MNPGGYLSLLGYIGYYGYFAPGSSCRYIVQAPPNYVVKISCDIDIAITVSSIARIENGKNNNNWIFIRRAHSLHVQPNNFVCRLTALTSWIEECSIVERALSLSPRWIIIVLLVMFFFPAPKDEASSNLSSVSVCRPYSDIVWRPIQLYNRFNVQLRHEKSVNVKREWIKPLRHHLCELIWIKWFRMIWMWQLFYFRSDS